MAGCARFCPHTPTDKQLAALLLADIPEILYGGAGGGGKTDFLLMDALQYVDVPHYRALILRADYPRLSLPDSILSRAKSWWIPYGVHWHEQSKTFTFPSGAQIVFGYLESENDKYRYGSASFQFIAFDELTEFPRETDYTFLFSRLRKPSSSALPLRMRAASNPTGPGYEWVRRRFIDGAPDPHLRLFVPARLDDNPHIDSASYRRSLGMLDPITRQKILDGDWTVSERTGIFRREWFRIAEAIHDRPAALCRAWDLAATDPARSPSRDPDWTAGVLMARFPDASYAVLDVVRRRATPARIEAVIRSCSLSDGPQTIIAVEEEPGASGKALIDHLRRNVVPDRTLRAVRKTGSKISLASPFASMAEAGHVRVLSAPWTCDFLSELDLFPHGSHDDQVDAAAMAYQVLSSSASPPALASVSSAESIRRNGERSAPLADSIRRRSSIDGEYAP